MNKQLGLQYAGGGLDPHEFKEIQLALYFSIFVLRVHAPAHALSRPRLRMV